MILKGRAHKYGKDVNTDLIIPARYLRTIERASLSQYCMADLDATFVERMKPGDFIVAETNFGCGSSREQAPLVIQASGVAAVIAASFARIFFRNAINIGLPILESFEAAEMTKMGDKLEVDLGTGEIRNLTRQKTCFAKPYPDFMQRIIDKGGLISYTRDRLKEQRVEK